VSAPNFELSARSNNFWVVRKSDQVDAEKLARFARLDPKLLRPIGHGTVQQQKSLKLPVDPDPNQHGERYCTRCDPKNWPRKRICMSFMQVKSWHCQFLEEDLKTPLPRMLTFATDDKVTELVRRCGGLTNLESKQSLERGIDMGRGSVFLNLTSEQYALLKKS
jgi:hypothetical protein